MKVYTVHLRRHGLDLDHDLILVEEGFCWSAFFLSLPWAIWYRLWWPALGITAGALILNQIFWIFHLDSLTSTTLILGYALLIGLLANDLRRWQLERQGFASFGVTTGQTKDEALGRFLDASPDIRGEFA